MPLLVAERTLLLITAFIVLFSGEQKIEPQWERCKDISELRLAEGRRGRVWLGTPLVRLTLLRGSFCCDSGAQTSSLDRQSILVSYRFYCL